MDNPYQVIGTRFTKEEYEVLQMGLTAVAQHAKQNENKDVYHRCLSLMERLQQYTVAGQGVPEELDQQFAERLERAMMEQKSKTIIVTLRKWIAARIRLDPDPAKAVAEHVTQIMLTAMGRAQVEQTGGVLLDLVSRKLAAMYTIYEREGWPQGPDVLQYLRTWVDHGIANLEKGRDPWAGDPHILEADDEEEEED